MSATVRWATYEKAARLALLQRLREDKRQQTYLCGSRAQVFSCRAHNAPLACLCISAHLASQLCEAAVAVARLAAPRGSGKDYDAEWTKLCNADDNAAWVFARKLMEVQESYFDGPARNKNADQVSVWRRGEARRGMAIRGEPVRD